MKTGFLTLLTHPAHPELVLARTLDKPPELYALKDGSEIRYVARFADIEAALMHLQNSMHTALVDLENRCYRKSLAEMIAAVEADGLEHRRIWIDPAIPAEALTHIERLTQKARFSQRRIDRIWQAVGVLGLLLLLFFSLRV